MALEPVLELSLVVLFVRFVNLQELKMTKAIQEKVILNEIKEISLNRIGGNIPYLY